MGNQCPLSKVKKQFLPAMSYFIHSTNQWLFLSKIKLRRIETVNTSIVASPRARESILGGCFLRARWFHLQGMSLFPWHKRWVHGFLSTQNMEACSSLSLQPHCSQMAPNSLLPSLVSVRPTGPSSDVSQAGSSTRPCAPLPEVSRAQQGACFTLTRWESAVDNHCTTIPRKLSAAQVS